jgi:hemerythrin
MTYFPWSDEYSVHLRVIDNDHKELVGMVNALHDAIANGAKRPEIAHIIGNLARYVDEHFDREEALMQTYDYPLIVRHKRIHRHLRRVVHAIRIIFSSRPKDIDPVKLLAFLKDWLLEHILKEDMKYVPFLRGDDDAPLSLADDVEAVDAAVEHMHQDELVTLSITLPASKAAALTRAARMLSDGGPEAIAIEDIVLPVSHMTFDEALKYARPILR